MTDTTSHQDLDQLFLAAIGAAGPAQDDITEWLRRVDGIADGLYARRAAFVKRCTAVAKRITLVGVVLDIEENPISEAGRQLNFFKVHFQADAGQRRDQMWLDKHNPRDCELFEIARSLIGKRARIEKLQRVEFRGDEPVLGDDGEPITRPHLGSIEPLVEEGAEAGTEPFESSTEPATTNGKGSRSQSGQRAGARSTDASAPAEPATDAGTPTKAELLLKEPERLCRGRLPGPTGLPSRRGHGARGRLERDPPRRRVDQERRPQGVGRHGARQGRSLSVPIADIERENGNGKRERDDFDRERHPRPRAALH